MLPFFAIGLALVVGAWGYRRSREPAHPMLPSALAALVAGSIALWLIFAYDWGEQPNHSLPVSERMSPRLVPEGVLPIFPVPSDSSSSPLKEPSALAGPPKPHTAPTPVLPAETGLKEAQLRRWSMLQVALARQKAVERRARIRRQRLNSLRAQVRRHAKATNKARREMGKKPFKFSGKKLQRITNIGELKKLRKRWRDRRRVAAASLKKFRERQKESAQPPPPPAPPEQTLPPASSGGGTDAPPGGSSPPATKCGEPHCPDPAPEAEPPLWGDGDT